MFQKTMRYNVLKPRQYSRFYCRITQPKEAIINDFRVTTFYGNFVMATKTVVIVCRWVQNEDKSMLVQNLKTQWVHQLMVLLLKAWFCFLFLKTPSFNSAEVNLQWYVSVMSVFRHCEMYSYYVPCKAVYFSERVIFLEKITNTFVIYD